MGKLWYAIFVSVVILTFSGCRGEKAQEPETEQGGNERERKTIVAVGDSLTAGMGVPEEESYPAQLERKLQADGYGYRVVNAGVSGETSSGTLARLNWILSLEPDIVILETGANDGLRGINPQVLEDNLREMLTILEEKGVVAVLAGMKMVRNLGPTYVARFDAVYPQLADEYDPVFIPFFLKDVAMHPSLNQEDSIHPNAAGYRKITENLYPYVLQAIRRSEGQGQ